MSLVGYRAQNHPQQTAARGARDVVDDRGTLPGFFQELDAAWGFDLDVAAAPHNAKCARYYTIEDDGLTMPWTGRVWCNPPYSDLASWLDKAWTEWGERHAEAIVMLLPANRTEQRWWQEYVEPQRDRYGDRGLRVEFLPGRLRFERPDAVIGPKGDRPPFGCCLLKWGAPL